MGQSTQRERALRAIRRSLPAAAQTHIQDFLEGLAQAIEQEIAEATHPLLIVDGKTNDVRIVPEMQEEDVKKWMSMLEAADQQVADLMQENQALRDKIDSLYEESNARDEADAIEREERMKDGQ